MSINTLSGVSLSGRKYSSFGQENLPITDTNNTGSPAIFQLAGGISKSGTTAYANGDAVALQFNTAGELKVDTEISVSGITIDNIKVYSTDGTIANSKYGLVDATNQVVTVGSVTVTNDALPISGTISVVATVTDMYMTSGNSYIVSGANVDVTQGTSPWVTLGSTQITNPGVVGSLATQGVIGSVNIDNAVTVGSLAIQGVLGSAAITNTVSVNSTTQITPAAIQATVLEDNASAATSVIAKTAGSELHVLSILVSNGSPAKTVRIQDDSAGPVVLMQDVFLAENGGFVQTFPAEAPLQLGSNVDLDFIASAAGSVSITVTGYKVPTV